MDKIETLFDWNLRLSCCCSMPGCPIPITRVETISASACGFAMPEFPNMTEAQRNTRYEQLDISREYDINIIDNDLVFIALRKQNTHEFSDNDYQTSYKKVRNENGLCLSATKIASSHTGSYTVIISTEHKAESEYEEDTSSGSTHTKTWAASGGENQDATGTYTNSISGTNPGGSGYSSSTTTPYVYHGLSENEFIHEAEFQGGGTFVKEVIINRDDSNSGRTYTFYSREKKTRTYSKPIKPLELLSKKSFPDDAYENSSPISELTWSSASRSRFQFAIPSDHLGSYFKISWDYLEEPEGSNLTIPDPAYTGTGIPPRIPKPGRPKKTLKDGGTWTWKGPGSLTDPDGSSWKSPWFEVPVPTSIGKISRKNVRFNCYRGPYGTKPQVTGDAYDE